MPRRRDSLASPCHPDVGPYTQVVHSTGVGFVPTTTKGGTEDAFAL